MTNETDSVKIEFAEEDAKLASVKEVSSELFLSCESLRYRVNGKEILRGIDANFRPGRVTAVMGSSGAGKTTLLSLLSGDLIGDRVSEMDYFDTKSRKGAQIAGKVCLNGSSIHNLQDVGKVSGFVYQDDVILETMTVEEAIRMSARLRLPENTSTEEIEGRCHEVMDILGIKKCAKTIVGSAESKGISGGERKRLSLAMELIPNPSILFLDEPTSGLDTVNAFNVVNLLATLAHQTDRTIIITIHQPPSEIFHLLDDLLLLADGRVVYHGPVSNAVAYFERLGYKCPMYTNPADFFFLELLGNVVVNHDQYESSSLLPRVNGKGDARSGSPASNLSSSIMASCKQESNSSRIEELCSAWAASEEAKLVLAAQVGSHGPSKSFKVSHFRQERASFWRQFGLLMKRAGLNVLRNRMILRVKFMQTVIIGLLIGLTYLKSGYGDPLSKAQIQDVTGSLYFIVVNQFMSSSMGILSVFSKEKVVFLREHRLGYYKLPAYFCSKILVELPYQILFPFLFVCITYYMVGFRQETGYFFTFALITILTALNGMAVGTLAASVFNAVEVALAILPVFLIPMMLFSGFMKNNDSIPDFFIWIPYIAPTKYAFHAVMKNQFEDLGKYGNGYLTEMGLLNGPSIWVNAVILFGSYLGFMALAYLSLYFLSRRK